MGWVFLRFCVVLVCAVATSTGANAAELRLTYAELATAVQAVIGDAKLHLANKPSGFLSGPSGSSLTIAGTTKLFPLTPKSFNLLGSTYAYFVDDLNSDAISVASVASAVRITLNFQSKPGSFVGACVSGDCGLVDALPVIVWKNGTVAIDVVPVRYAPSVALQVRAVTIGGSFSARCEGTRNIFLDGTCKAGLGWANRTIANLKPDMAALVKANVNDVKTQSEVANAFKNYLVLGPTGTIDISNVSSDAKGVAITFSIIGKAGG